MYQTSVEGFRLSPQQSHLWELQQTSAAYHVQCVLSLDGALDVKTLKDAVGDTIARHEILRTVFQYLPGIKKPVQVINDSDDSATTACFWHELDLRHLSASDQQTALSQLLDGEAAHRFDFAGGPLLRLCVVGLNEHRHVLVLTQPAMCADGWSAKMLVDDIARSYDARLRGHIFDGEAAQYADLSEWEHEIQEEEDAIEARAHWLESLSAGTPLPALSFEQRPFNEVAEDTFSPARVDLATLPLSAHDLRALTRLHQCSPDAFFLAGWQALLARLSQHSDVLLAVECDGRRLEELRSALGLFARNVPLRTRLKRHTAFSDLLRATDQALRQARELQDYWSWDAEQYQSALPQRRFFKYAFAIESRARETTIGNLKIGVLSQYQCVEAFALKLTCLLLDDGSARCELHYDQTLFERADVERLGRQYVTLLGDALADAAQRIADLDILHATERDELVVQFNDTTRAFDLEGGLHELFERHAAQTPDAVAVVCEDGQLSYGELNGRANQLAHHLRRRGVGAESVVGVMVERSLEMVVAVLGVLKAGGAYLPLDAAYPQERLAYMLADADASILLTKSGLAGRVPAGVAGVVLLDAEWAEISRESVENPRFQVSPENLAYVIYTSGSTGQPKGVMIAHAAVVNYLCWCVEAYRVAEGTGAVVHSPLSFDLTVTSLWSPLVSGRRAVLVSEERGVEGLIAALRSDEGFSLMKLTPAHMELVGQELRAEEVGASRTGALVIGGEALRSETVRVWRERAPQVRVINEYGPTETAVGCCVYEVGGGEMRVGGVPIGRPIANTELYVMDAGMRLAATGERGELYIGGRGVGRGYVGRAEQTAERFVPDGYSGRLGGRLYRTGDMVEHGAGGELVYVGRVDGQVKVRGYRIELGEIEAVLQRHDAVREATVTVREDKPGEKRIVAYIVAERNAMPVSGELRSFMAEKLPEYMLPSNFIMLKSLPLTQNGKVDHAALPAVDGSSSELRQSFAPPRTLAEELLAGIWSEVLGVEKVSIDDNFFALGGDSIRSIQISAQAQRRGLALTHQLTFQHQSIREIARHVGFEKTEVVETLSTPPFSLVASADREKLPDHIEDAYPLGMLQAGMIFHSEYETDAPVFHDLHSFHLQAQLDEEVLRSAVRDLIARHAILRSSFDLIHFSEPLQLVHKTVDTPLVIEDLQHLSSSEQENAVASWLETEKQQMFDWTRAPLLRFHAHRRAVTTFQFTLSFHHAILDGWSVATMLTELFQQYLLLLGQSPTTIEQPEVTYRDYVALEQKALRSEEAQRYWNEYLSDSTVTGLPRLKSVTQDAAHVSMPEVRVINVPVMLDVSEGLKRIARRTSVPIKSVLLAAHLRVMSLLGGQSDVLTGIVSNGRPEAKDGERALGLFLNTLPFRHTLSGGTWAELAQEVFELEREMMPHRWYPLARIQKQHGSLPLFETAFNFMHYHVYRTLQGLQEASQSEALGYTGFEQTNFTLLANFGLDVDTSQVQLNISFNSTDLTTAQMEAISNYYARALEEMAADASQRYEHASLLSSTELQLLFGWNETEQAYDALHLLHINIQAQVERTPDAVALIFEDQQLSYRELNARANQLAHLLHQRGVGPDVLVGVMAERSPEMVVALLGILKAGGAYLPLDPSYPHERLAFMLEHSQATLLLTQSQLSAHLPPTSAEVILLDTDWPLVSQYGTENPHTRVTPENLAYVIYTSGSTGQPKGVMISHRGIANRLFWMQQAFQLSAADCVLQKTPFSFDVSVWEFFWPLMTGARLVVARPDGHRDPAYLLDLIEREEVTTLHFVPSMLQVFVEAEGVGTRTRSLRQVMSSGEALPMELVRRYEERVGHRRAQLHNLYGPTEASVDVTWWEAEGGAGRVAIGRPIANTQMYVLDERQEAVPVGVMGELYIGGVGLGRGYVGRAEQTAERFVPHAYAREAGERLYRTGDIGRWQEDGTIEYVGRVDGQVKVRGYRIELGEIEAVVMGHEGVREAVVVAREDGSGGSKRLVCYWVKEEGAEVSAAQVREQVRERLPEYMVPSAMVMLGEMPLTANGKVDRKALPEAEAIGGEREPDYLAARTRVEEALTGIWREVLGVERVGVFDNFFEIGGDSLIATRLVSRMRETFQMELSLKWFFNTAPTIADMAKNIEQNFIDEAAADELAEALRDLEGLSDDEAKALLATEVGLEPEQVLQ